MTLIIVINKLCIVNLYILRSGIHEGFKFAGIVALLFALVLVTACGNVSNNGSGDSGNKSSSKDSIKIKHELGTTKVPKDAKRVVALNFHL